MQLCATGEWRVGAKRVFELFPGGLKARSRAERKRSFLKLQRQAVNAAASHAARSSQEPHVSSHFILAIQLSKLMWQGSLIRRCILSSSHL